MVILRNLEVFQGFRDAFLSSTAFIKNIDSSAFPSFPSPSHPWAESAISVPEISHHVPLHQQPWQQCRRSKVGLFAAFWALLPNTERLHRNNEELQCTGQLPGKLKKCFNRADTSENFLLHFSYYFWVLGQQIRPRELIRWVRKCHFYTSVFRAELLF